MTTERKVPPSAEPLLPYLRSRRDALRIRQALTLYLQSQIIQPEAEAENTTTTAATGPADPEKYLGHISLAIPTNTNLTVNRIPSELILIGARREYLEALKEYSSVKSEYNDLCDRVASLSLTVRKSLATDSRPPAAGAAATDVKEKQAGLWDYVALLSERRRCERLRHFDVALTQWMAASAASGVVIKNGNGNENWRTGARRNDLATKEGIGVSAEEQPGRGDVQELISRLEKTVLRVKAKLAKEENLLRQLREEQAERTLTDEKEKEKSLPSKIKIYALQRTRQELVDWIEEKLIDDTTTTTETQDRQDATIQEDIQQTKTRIQQLYTVYVEGRRSLLDAVSVLSQSPDTLTSPAKAGAASTSASALSSVKGLELGQTEPSDSVEVFQTASQQILPAVRYQKSIALHRSYVTRLLAREKATVKQTLDRLRQESHLLPEYPVLVHQPKFKHITTLSTSSISSTAGVAGLRRSDHEKKILNPQDDVLQSARAWAFAAEAATTSDQEYVQGRIEYGADMADTAVETIQQIYETLRQERKSGSSVEDQSAAADESDIWTAEMQPRKTRVRHEDKTRQRGPWAMLQGGII